MISSTASRKNENNIMCMILNYTQEKVPQKERYPIPAITVIDLMLNKILQLLFLPLHSIQRLGLQNERIHVKTNFVINTSSMFLTWYLLSAILCPQIATSSYRDPPDPSHGPPDLVLFLYPPPDLYPPDLYRDCGLSCVSLHLRDPLV